MDKRPDPRAVFWANVRALMLHHYGKENLTRFAEDTKVGPGTMSRIKSGQTHVQLDTIEKICAKFDLAPWQLLVPGMEPANRRCCVTPARANAPSTSGSLPSSGCSRQTTASSRAA